MLVVAKRSLNTKSQFAVTCDVSKQVVNESSDDRLTVSQLSSIDGEYLILVK